MKKQPIELASVFSDQMNAIEAASTTNKVIDAIIVFGIAAGANVVADRTNLPIMKWICWGFSGLGAYILYLAFFA
jgi:hypothetical protein